ncbi:hypothetical protein F2Q69_00047040 [Brassica cretica]|uniref:Uncharacterized protein n=1 Tax=Brassica cretica TaxID=69181 RepID=A0A8S9PYQ8_BRACR|nr:hypothetical protein F2Q69_00047040 [Brassica cretica]
MMELLGMMPRKITYRGYSRDLFNMHVNRRCLSNHWVSRDFKATSVFVTSRRVRGRSVNRRADATRPHAQEEDSRVNLTRHRLRRTFAGATAVGHRPFAARKPPPHHRCASAAAGDLPVSHHRCWPATGLRRLAGRLAGNSVTRPSQLSESSRFGLVCSIDFRSDCLLGIDFQFGLNRFEIDLNLVQLKSNSFKENRVVQFDFNLVKAGVHSYHFSTLLRGSETSGLAMLLVRACGAKMFVPWTLLERAEVQRQTVLATLRVLFVHVRAKLP